LQRFGHFLLLLFFLPWASPCLLAQAGGPADDAGKSLETLLAEYGAALEAYLEPYRRATTDEERERISLDPAAHPAHAFLARFERFAAGHGASEVALSAHLQVLELADAVGGQAGKSAIERTLGEIFARHRESRELHRLADWLRVGHPGCDSKWARAQAERLRDASPDPLVRGCATLAIGDALWLDARARKDAELEARATATLRAGIELLRPLDDPIAVEHAAQAAGFLFRLEHLRVGKPFPEIEGQDATGASFKLSDYRGKVRVIEFWGLW
jgi:hypothetical protein